MSDGVPHSAKLCSITYVKARFLHVALNPVVLIEEINIESRIDQRMSRIKGNKDNILLIKGSWWTAVKVFAIFGT